MDYSNHVSPEAVISAAPQITVVVTACADSPALRRCLATLCEQAHALGGGIEVLLMLNAAPETLSDEARRGLEARCDRLAFEPRVGKSHALNSAVRLSRGEVIAFTDDDAEPQPGWLAALTAPLLESDRDPALVGCGGPVRPIWTNDVPAWLRSLTEKKGTTSLFLIVPIHDLGPNEMDYDLHDKSRRVPPIGANCAYRREVFAAYHYDARLGPNRDTGMRGGEDVLLGRLLLRDGYRLLYRPDAEVRHPVHPERVTEAYLRHRHYVHGVALERMKRSVSGKPSSRRKAFKLRGRIFLLRSILVFHRLLPCGARNEAARMRRIGKCEMARGRLDEL